MGSRDWISISSLLCIWAFSWSNPFLEFPLTGTSSSESGGLIRATFSLFSSINRTPSLTNFHYKWKKVRIVQIKINKMVVEATRYKITTAYEVYPYQVGSNIFISCFIRNQCALD
jgi:hypothetical protein